jgi:membrane-associated phospholipid phosphatase
MFLNKNNKIKWKLVIASAVVVMALCIIGVFWLDVPSFIFIRQFDGMWARMLDVVFSSKMWVRFSFYALIIALIFNTKKIVSQIKNLKDHSIRSLWKDRGKIFHDKWLVASFSVFCSVFIAAEIGSILKFSIGRMRPVFLEALGQTGFYPFTKEWAFNSMPSGHAITSFAALVMIGLIYPKYKWLTWTLAIVIGASRISFGAHYPSDVLLGAFLGMLTADFVRAKIS